MREIEKIKTTTSIIESILKDLGLESPEHPTTDLLELGLDSIGFLNLIANLEGEFKLSIPNEDLLFDNFRTVALIEGYLVRICSTAK